MALALYTPDFGYYSSEIPKFGKSGDFITAPELSSLFAQSIAQQCRQILTSLDGGDILELGAGSGKFAADLLMELHHLNCLPHYYFIFEKSDALRKQQQERLKTTLPQLIDRIVWLDEFPPPNKIKGILLAHEVLEAQPVHCFEIGKNEITERSVTLENGQFTWKITPPTTPLLTRHVEIILQECPLNAGYQSEINLNLDHLVSSMAASLERGVILLFDYGYGRREYYHPDRMRGTLTCFSKHRAHEDPFQHIGLQDITAHVDFTAVIESAIGADLHLGGFTTQSSFLLACGLLDLAHQWQQNQAIKTLTLPSQMGELIKVMALTKHFKEPLLGFNLHDRRRSL